MRGQPQMGFCGARAAWIPTVLRALLPVPSILPPAPVTRYPTRLDRIIRTEAKAAALDPDDPFVLHTLLEKERSA